MKTLKDIESTLSQVYKRDGFHATIKQINGFDYVPWNESTKLANTLFGFLGWSSSVLSCEYVECVVPVYNRDTKAYDDVEFRGFKSIVRVSVRVYDDEHNEVVESHHDGVGFGEVIGQGKKNPMDSASKSAKSDGISTAVKHFGDYFGLFLYDKEDQPQESTGGYTRQPTAKPQPQRSEAPWNRDRQQPAPSGGAVGQASEKQANVLRRAGLVDEQIGMIERAKLSACIKAAFDQKSADDILNIAGIAESVF